MHVVQLKTFSNEKNFMDPFVRGVDFGKCTKRGGEPSKVLEVPREIGQRLREGWSL